MTQGGKPEITIPAGIRSPASRKALQQLLADTNKQAECGLTEKHLAAARYVYLGIGELPK